MNPRIKKIEQEIDKLKGKVASYQTRCRELEQQKRELENTEIVGVVRSMWKLWWTRLPILPMTRRLRSLLIL